MALIGGAGVMLPPTADIQFVIFSVSFGQLSAIMHNGQLRLFTEKHSMSLEISAISF